MLDFMMPIMDGTTMLATMREDPAFTATPVIMMSSLDEASVRSSAKGFNGFLRKPFRALYVVELVAKLLAAR